MKLYAGLTYEQAVRRKPPYPTTLYLMFPSKRSELYPSTVICLTNEKNLQISMVYEDAYDKKPQISMVYKDARVPYYCPMW